MSVTKQTPSPQLKLHGHPLEEVFIYKSRGLLYYGLVIMCVSIYFCALAKINVGKKSEQPNTA